jgi:enterochelin esterase family protein
LAEAGLRANVNDRWIAARALALGWPVVTRDSEAEEVPLFANRITDERNLAASLMRRVPGADVWHLSYRMRADWRASYGFATHTPGATWPWADADQDAIRDALDRARPDPATR